MPLKAGNDHMRFSMIKAGSDDWSIWLVLMLIIMGVCIFMLDKDRSRGYLLILPWTWRKYTQIMMLIMMVKKTWMVVAVAAHLMRFEHRIFFKSTKNCRGAWKQSWAMETKTHLRWTPLPSFLHSCKRQLGKRQAPVLKMPNSCTSVYCSVIPFASQDNHSSKPQKCRDAWKQSWAMETKTHLRWTPLPSFLHSCKRQLGKRQAPVLKMPNSCTSVYCSVIPFASQDNHSSKPQKCRDAWKQSWAMETKTHLRWTPLPSFLHSCKRQLGKR